MGEFQATAILLNGHLNSKAGLLRLSLGTEAVFHWQRPQCHDTMSLITGAALYSHLRLRPPLGERKTCLERQRYGTHGPAL